MTGRPLLRRAAPPSLADKLRRALWGLVWLLLFRPSPTPLHAWRRLLLRLFGARIARAAIYPDVQVWAPWNIVVGKHATIGGGANLYAVGAIRIQDGAIISQRAHLCGASHDIHSPSFDLMLGDIDIGPNAWIAAEAFIGPGVSIGADAVVAARAVVTRPVPAGVVVAGNPARKVSLRAQTGKNLLQHL